MVAIACGGSGGHLFPGLAAAERLLQRGCAVTLFVSPREVDQRGVSGWLREMDKRRLDGRQKEDLRDERAWTESADNSASSTVARALSRDEPQPLRQGKGFLLPIAGAAGVVSGVKVVVLPAVGLQRGGQIAFVRGLIQSYRASKKVFASYPPQAALAMGGFTSAPVILAARRGGARTFLHESNAIPGRANRWLSRIVDHAFVGFPSAGARLHCRNVRVTGTPVRPQFQVLDAAVCREALGLDAGHPVVLVMGGSQGAGGINEIVMKALPLLAKLAPDLQWFHLSGAADCEKVERAYAASKLKAVVHPFFDRMELALGAATAAISRAGASSLAEIAAVRVPAVLVPYPAAMNNHQFHNARAFAATGAARLLKQSDATSERVAPQLLDLVENAAARQTMQGALARWHYPSAAEQIVSGLLATAAP